MLDLNKLNELAKLTVKRVIRDYPEEDKILIDIDEIIQEVVRQNAKDLNEVKNKSTIESIFVSKEEEKLFAKEVQRVQTERYKSE
jgi:hypothetical protein